MLKVQLIRSFSSYVIPVHCLSLMKAVREFCNASNTASVVLEIWERLMVTLALSSCAAVGAAMWKHAVRAMILRLEAMCLRTSCIFIRS